jgi:hypothetical protein
MATPACSKGQAAPRKRIRAWLATAATRSGPQHRRELAQHAWQTPSRHHRHAVHDDLAPRDLDTVDGHDRHHHLGVGEDLGGPVGLEPRGAQGRSEG